MILVTQNVQSGGSPGPGLKTTGIKHVGLILNTERGSLIVSRFGMQRKRLHVQFTHVCDPEQDAKPHHSPQSCVCMCDLHLLLLQAHVYHLALVVIMDTAQLVAGLLQLWVLLQDLRVVLLYGLHLIPQLRLFTDRTPVKSAERRREEHESTNASVNRTTN